MRPRPRSKPHHGAARVALTLSLATLPLLGAASPAAGAPREGDSASDRSGPAIATQAGRPPAGCALRAARAARRRCQARRRCVGRRGNARRRCLARVGHRPFKLHAEAPGASGDVSRAFVDPKGRKVTLNGFNVFPTWKDPTRVAWGQRHYDAIRAKGFTAVRFVTAWRYYETGRGVFTGLDKLDAAVRLARNAGLYVILVPFLEDAYNAQPAWATVTRSSGCINHDATGDRALDKILSDGRRYLQKLVRRYKGNHTVAAYDLIGEPHGTNRQNCLLRLYSTVIDWVRAIDRDKIVIVEPGWGSNDMSPAFVDPASLRHRRNVVHSWHMYYAGGGGRGYNRWGMNSGRSTGDGRSGYPDPGRGAELEAQVRVHVGFARRAGIPLFVGEYGVNPQAPNAGAWASQVTRLFQRYGLSRTWWLYGLGPGSRFSPRNPDGSWKPIVDLLL